jgi:hypothetical protein
MSGFLGGGRSLKRRFTKLKRLFFRYKSVFSVSWKIKINNGFLELKNKNKKSGFSEIKTVS